MSKWVHLCWWSGLAPGLRSRPAQTGTHAEAEAGRFFNLKPPHQAYWACLPVNTCGDTNHCRWNCHCAGSTALWGACVSSCCHHPSVIWAACADTHLSEVMSELPGVHNIGKMTGWWLCCVCAGQHRGLGTMVSKVQSLKLDTSVWSNEIVQVSPEPVHHLSQV